MSHSRGIVAALPLEERVAILEAEVGRLKNRLVAHPALGKPWWEQIRDTFADAPAFEEAERLGRESRTRPS